MSTLGIKKIKLSHIMGLDGFEFQPGKITRIKGKNGLGKTSIAKGLLTALSSGNPVEIIRNGNDKAEVAIEFTDNSVLAKSLTRDGRANLNMKDASGQKLSKPQSLISALVDGYSFNPISIIAASKKDRVSILLESLPMKATKDDFRAIFNGFVDHPTFPSHVLDMHALNSIEYMSKMVYEKRTDVNSQLKKANATIESLKETLPQIEIKNLDDIIFNLEKDQKSLEAKLYVDSNSAKQKQAQVLDDIQEEYNSKLQDLNNWLNNAKEAARAEAAEEATKIQNEYYSKLNPIKEELIKIREIQKNQAATLRQRQIVEEQEKEALVLMKKSETFTESLKKLEGLKSKYLSNLPIPGLDVRDGEIFFKDVPFDQLNSQAQIDLAKEISLLRAKDLGFVFVDGFERLDTDHQAVFIESFRQTDLQLLITEVSDDEELQIIVEN